MGIEPTDRMLYTRPSGFEDRGGHQPAKHFRTVFHRVVYTYDQVYIRPKREEIPQVRKAQSRFSAGAPSVWTMVQAGQAEAPLLRQDRWR